MAIVGGTYFLRGEPVTVLVAWRQQPKAERFSLPLVSTKATTPRNVLLEHADGSRSVRPFRGLRRSALLPGGQA
jgi:hypothetical protein